MRKIFRNLFIFILAMIALLILALDPFLPTVVSAQQPTGIIPTVTGTPLGPYITVTYPEQINVRSGPNSTTYPAIGVLLPGETAPAIGRSQGGEWIQISYAGVANNIGWVYAPLVNISPNANLMPVDAPPTPTPLTTATIDPVLATAYIPEHTPTRLPTFTPAAPIEPLVFDDNTGGINLPLGTIIATLFAIGLFAAIVSLIRDR